MFLRGNLIAKCNINSLRLLIFPVIESLTVFEPRLLSPSHILQYISLTLPLFFSVVRSHSLSLSAHFLLSLSEELSWLDLRSKRSATQRLFVVAFFHKVFVRKSRISLLCSPFHAFSFFLSLCGLLSKHSCPTHAVHHIETKLLNLTVSRPD